MFRTVAVIVSVVLVGGAAAFAQTERPPFQDLDEATERIDRLENKPYKKLIDAEGRWQAELLIFKDTTTGHEIWSLTNEKCTELANIEQQPAWNCDGSIVSLVGSRMFRDAAGKIVGHQWPGDNYLMRADGTGRRKLKVASPDGQTGIILSDKFNTWDRRDPRAAYYTAIKDAKGVWDGWNAEKLDAATLYLVRVRLDDKLGGKLEPLYRFGNNRRKIIQNISDDNKLLIQDRNARIDRNTEEPEYMPNFYVIDLNKKPDQGGFARVHPLAYDIQDVGGHDPENEFQVHNIAISRDGKWVEWNYGPSSMAGEYIHFKVPADNLDARPVAWDKESDPFEQFMSGVDTFSDGRKAYFSQTTDKLKALGAGPHRGLWVRLPGKTPVPVGGRISGGFITWCGNDPDWFFAYMNRTGGEQWSKRLRGNIVAAKADGSKVVVLCNPYHIYRGGGRGGYDALPRPNQSPDATKCWYHSSMLMPSNRYTGSYVVVFRRPHAPVALAFAAGRLTYTPHKVSREVANYLLYRQEENAWKLAATAKADAGGFDAAKAGTYMVTALEHSGLESDTSSPTITLPAGKAGPAVKGWDKTPPAAPGDFTAAREAPGQYRLKWTAPADEDVRYYNLYHSIVDNPKPVQKHRFASVPKGTTTYLDWAAPTDADDDAYYGITTVDRQANESAPAYASVPAKQ